MARENARELGTGITGGPDDRYTFRFRVRFHFADLSAALCACAARRYARDLLHVLRKRRRRSGVAKCHENCVVAADGAKAIFRRRCVERARHRLGGGGRSFQNDEISCPISKNDRVAEEMIELFLSTRREERNWSEISREHIARGTLGQAKLADVARECRLRHAEAALAQDRQQLVLRVHRLFADDVDDFLMPCMNIHYHAFLCNIEALSSISFALAPLVSRVEPKEQPPKREAKDERRPSQAEGSEEDVNEALRREEQKRPED